MSFLFIYPILLSTYYLEHLLSRNVWFTEEYNDIPDKNLHSCMGNRQVNDQLKWQSLLLKCKESAVVIYINELLIVFKWGESLEMVSRRNKVLPKSWKKNWL